MRQRSFRNYVYQIQFGQPIAVSIGFILPLQDIDSQEPTLQVDSIKQW